MRPNSYRAATVRKRVRSSNPADLSHRSEWPRAIESGRLADQNENKILVDTHLPK